MSHRNPTQARPRPVRRRHITSMIVALIPLLLTNLPATPAQAISNDLFAQGTRLVAYTYPGHTTYAGHGPVMDVNFVTGRDTDCGAPLYAPFDGTFEARPDPTHGNRGVLTSSSGGTRFTMGHLQNYETTGRVRRGDLIARVGKTGDARYCHLHIAMQRNGQPANLELSGVTVVDSGTRWTSAGPGTSTITSPPDPADSVLLSPRRHGPQAYWTQVDNPAWGQGDGRFWWTWGAPDNRRDVNYATWGTSRLTPGHHRLAVFIPGNYAAGRVTYHVRAVGGTSRDVTVNQSRHHGYVDLGLYYVPNGGISITAGDAGVDGRMGVDVIRATKQ